MRFEKLAIGLIANAVLAAGVPLAAQEAAPTLAEQAFADLERRYAPSDQVRQVAYESAPAHQNSAPSFAAPSVPAVAAPTIIPPANAPVVYPSPAADSSMMVYPSSEVWDCPPVDPRPSVDWIVGIELLPMESHLTRARFGPWTADPGFGGRLILAMELDSGLGMRSRLWGMGFDDAPPAGKVEVITGALDLEFYKRFRFDESELLVGAGSTNRHLEFQLANSDSSEFTGAGANLFVEGYQPLIHFERSEIGFIGRGRWSLVDGEWRDSTGSVIAPTDHDSMSIMELAWGFEYRHLFGRRLDHIWTVGLLAEHQRWESSWMTEFIGSSAAFSGANINFGVTW